jgi:hypothetical protein
MQQEAAIETRGRVTAGFLVTPAVTSMKYCRARFSLEEFKDFS